MTASDVMSRYTDAEINRFFNRVYGCSWQELYVKYFGKKKGK